MFVPLVEEKYFDNWTDIENNINDYFGFLYLAIITPKGNEKIPVLPYRMRVNANRKEKKIGTIYPQRAFSIIV